MEGCFGPNCCTHPNPASRPASPAALGQPRADGKNSSRVLLKTCLQALLQPALSAQAKDLQVGPALGAILRGNAAHGADLQDGSSGEACNQDIGGGSGDLGSQFSAATYSGVGTAPRELDHCFPCSSTCLFNGIATKKEQSPGPQCNNPACRSFKHLWLWRSGWSSWAISAARKRRGPKRLASAISCCQ